VGKFGEELRHERESRGVPLETISEKTKVIKRYLTALEDEKFDALPGGILSKGIVRGYARTVGLDETVWVERFVTASREHGQSDGDWSAFVQNVGKARDQSRGHRKWGLRRTSLFVLLLVLMGFGWAVWRYGGRVTADEVQQHAVSSAATATPDTAGH
jgi:cytoskeletal protein RodZ